jgi:hypothetical protein
VVSVGLCVSAYIPVEAHKYEMMRKGSSSLLLGLTLLVLHVGLKRKISLGRYSLVALLTFLY